MPILDDEQFEQYLKEFHPVAPESLEIEKHSGRARRPFVIMGWAAACAAWENSWERSRAAMAGNLVAGALQLIALARVTGAVTWSTPARLP